MKFTANTKTLKAACATAKCAVSGKTTIPALECLLLRCDGSKMEIAGYDLELCIKTSVEVAVHEPGACLLDAALLCGILGKISAEDVTIETGGRDKAKITAGGLEYKLNTLTADDFPDLPTTADAEAHITVEPQELKRMIKGTVFACATSADTKPIHTGVLFEHDGTKMELAAIDGFRLAHIQTQKAEYSGEAAKFVVPVKALKEIAGMKITADKVFIYRHKRHITFAVGDVDIISRLLDGEFMNYRAAIPADSVMELTVDATLLLAAVQRVSLIITEKIKAPLRMTLCPDDVVITLSCATGVGTAEERIPVASGTMQAMEIGFNHRYLADALADCTDDLVKLRIKSDVQPVVIVPPDADDYLHMVLPVRLKERS